MATVAATSTLREGEEDVVVRLVERIFRHGDALLARPLVWSVAVGVLIAVQAALVLTHTAWLDEWQALLIAIQSPDLPSLLENLRYEGHPPLWYLLLRGAALILPPLSILAGVQLVMALATQFVILFRSPFSRTERWLLGGSYFLLFEMGTLSRSLGLGTLLLFTFFVARRRAAVWATIILMPMVDMQFGLLSIIAIVLTIRDGRWSTAGAAAWLASSLLAALSVKPAADMVPALGSLGPLLELLRFFNNLGSLLIPIHVQDNAFQWSGTLPYGLGVVAGILFLAFSIRQLRGQPLYLALYVGFTLITLLFCMVIYPFGVRHLTLIALLLILLKGREAASGKPTGTLFRLWLLTLALSSMLVISILARQGFDSGSQATRFIRAHGLEKANWIAWPDSRGTGVAMELGRGMLTLEKGCSQSFMRWDKRRDIHKGKDLYDALRETTHAYGRSYLLTNINLADGPRDLLQPLASFPAGYSGYDYFLYTVSPQLTETAGRPRDCKPYRLPLTAAPHAGSTQERAR